MIAASTLATQMDRANLPAFFQVRIRLSRLAGTTLLFVHGVYGLKQLRDLLSRFLGHALKTLEERGDFGVRCFEVIASGLFHATKEVARTHTQGVCESAQRTLRSGTGDRSRNGSR